MGACVETKLNENLSYMLICTQLDILRVVDGAGVGRKVEFFKPELKVYT